MSKWFYIGIIFLITFAGIGIYTFYFQPRKEKIASPHTVLSIKIASVTYTEFADFVEAVGSTLAYQSADIIPNVTEVVESINFDDGQTVRKGEVIVRLRNGEEQALLEGARANLDEQNREIKRLSGLVESGAAAVSALDARKTQKTVAEQQILQYQAQIADRVIRAPFDGVLGLRNVSPGSLVSPQTIITTIDDLNTMRVDFTVPEIYLGQIRPHMPVKAQSKAYPDLMFEGEISEIDTRVNPISRAVLVRAEIPNEKHILKPGMLLYVELALEKTKSLTIPERSVVQEGSRQYVFKVSNNTVERRQVTLGRRKPGYVEVIAGLIQADSVATSGLQDLASNMTVKVGGIFERPAQPTNPAAADPKEGTSKESIVNMD